MRTRSRLSSPSALRHPPRARTARGLLFAAALLLPTTLLCPAGATIRLGDRNGPDTDGDGVADDIDRCPERAGPFENIGCPDRDEDGDGLVDRVDYCPTVPGPASGCPSGDGTPIVVQDPAQPAGQPVQAAGGQPAQGAASTAGAGAGAQAAAGSDLARLPGKRFEFAAPVKFIPATDQLTAEGRAAVEAAAKVIVARSELRRFLIEGHVDEPGNTAARARTLSTRRAEAVKRVLVEAGVAAARLRTRGFGYTKLLDKSETPAAALKNNRIEILVLD